MELGYIKEIEIVDNTFIAIVTVAPRVNKTATLYNAPNMVTRPLVGDFVSISQSGAEYVINSVFNNVECGEGGAKIYARDADGNVVASFELKNDGSHIGQNANGSFELTSAGIFKANHFEARP
jgi:hypothetical protein